MENAELVLISYDSFACIDRIRFESIFFSILQDVCCWLEVMTVVREWLVVMVVGTTYGARPAVPGFDRAAERAVEGVAGRAAWRRALGGRGGDGGREGAEHAAQRLSLAAADSHATQPQTLRVAAQLSKRFDTQH